MPKISTDQLVHKALQATQQAYAPYSTYSVGAALLCKSGEIITGCNVENSSYPVGICAEVNAIASAVARGHQTFIAIAIATPNGGSPCGYCRQFMAEFGTHLHVILCDYSGRIHSEKTLKELLPDSFILNPKS